MALGFFEAINPAEQVMNPNALDRRRKLAETLAQQGTSTAPVQHWTQAAARIAQALAGNIENSRLDAAEKANQAESNKLLMAAYDAMSGGGQQQRLASALTPDPNAPGAASTPVAAATPDAKPASAPLIAGGGASPVENLSALNGKSVRENAPLIQDYLATGGQNLNPQQLAWCAAAVNASLAKSGMPTTGSNMARSFLNYGETTPTPQKGDIAVFSRGDPNGPLGHVGFYMGDAPNGGIRVLGGNQGGGVNERVFPSSQLLDIRRPPGTGQQLPVTAYAPDQSSAPAAQGIARAMAQDAPMPPPRPPGIGINAPVTQLAGAATPSPAGAVVGGAPVAQAPQQSPGSNQRAALVALLTSPYASQEAKQIGVMMMRDQMGPGKTIDLGDRFAILNHQNQITGYIPKSRDVIDDALKREQLNAARIANEKAKDPTTFGSVAEDEYGNKRYGFINPVTKSVTPYNIPPEQPMAAPQAPAASAPPAVPGQPPAAAPPAVAIEKPPPGADPKEWRREKTRMAANPDKLTEGQAKALQFANRMENAERTLGALEKMGTDTTERVKSAVPGIGNLLVSGDFQKYKQAEREFINSILRRESGAVISDSEYAGFSKQYFPQPGDTKEVIDQKRQSRRVALEAMKKEVPNYKSPEMPAAAPPPKPGVTDLGGGWTIAPVN